MTTLRVEKRPIEAGIYLTNSTVLRGKVFLSDFSAHHSGRQTVRDLMLDPDAMLPVRDRHDRFVLVGKQSVVAIETVQGPGSDPGLWVRVPVRIETSGGHRFEGTSLVDEGSGLRISDLINAGGPWIQISTRSSDVWIARHHILTARPDDGL